jgi:hypothetical protein
MTHLKSTLLCQAPHPRGKAVARFAGRTHGAILGSVPFVCVPTHRTFAQVADVPLGMVGQWCPVCKRASEYRVVAPVSEAEVA